MILEEGDVAENVYVILLGSVSKRNGVVPNDSDEEHVPVPEFLQTLFDGEMFGLPGKGNQGRMSYSIRTL